MFSYHQHYNTTYRSLHRLLCQIQTTRFITGYKRHLPVQLLFHLKSKNRTINYSYTAHGATKLPTFAKLNPLLESNATLCRQVGHDELLMTHDMSAFRNAARKRREFALVKRRTSLIYFLHISWGRKLVNDGSEVQKGTHVKHLS
jgi:hypothetical protein